MSLGFVFFFFFQAEDGIRDLTVTGVQTCALPILDRRLGLSVVPVCWPESLQAVSPCRTRTTSLMTRPSTQVFDPALDLLDELHRRSEERRVGKEARSWWWLYRPKEKHGRILCVEN